MSTTRIIFIIVCVVIAVIVFTIGVIMQRSDPDNKYSLTNVLKPGSAQKSKRTAKVFQNTRSYMTMFLLLVLVVLFLVFSRR